MRRIGALRPRAQLHPGQRCDPGIVDALNAARSRELAVIIQYMEHHYVAAGSEGLPSLFAQVRGDTWVRGRGQGLGALLAGTPGVVAALKAIAKVEMFHA